MPNIPENEDPKEIRLFGEKSIKEEAYRQKIIQLEKEIMKLESMLKNRQNETNVEYESGMNSKLPEYSEGLFYEAAVSMEEKVKKYQNMLEAKARDISERLNLQAQNLIEHEKIHRHVVTTKRALIILALFTLIAITMSALSIFTIPRLGDVPYQKDADSLNPYERPEYIKNLLQESGFYNKQYTIIDLDYSNQAYKGIVELHFEPHSNWTIKTIASDIIKNFKRISINKSMKLDFIYEGNTYAKVDYSYISDQTHYDFFTH